MRASVGRGKGSGEAKGFGGRTLLGGVVAWLGWRYIVSVDSETTGRKVLRQVTLGSPFAAGLCVLRLHALLGCRLQLRRAKVH
mgnify:CR=1 FL=1